MTVTILIPLHQSMRFFSTIDKNIAALSSSYKVIVSDSGELDDTLTLLRQKWDSCNNVVFFGKRKIGQGWIPHYNDLLARVETQFFMWLAHDDEIEISYVERCLTHLANDQNINGVVGHLVSIEGAGLVNQHYPLLPTKLNVNQYAFESNRLLLEWNLGILFRAVFRTHDAKPIKSAYKGDQFADVIWAYGFCLAHSIVQEPSAEYRKRVYSGSTHSQWDHQIMAPACLPFLLQEIEESPLTERDRAVCRQELVTCVASRIIGQFELAQAAVDLLRIQRDDTLRSLSWRLTAPIRGLVDFVKRSS